jgi:hypothetical protein
MDRLHASPFLSAVALGTLLVVAPPGTAQTRSAEKPEGKEATAPGQAPELSAEVMYRLLVGDIALQRGDPTLAARAYYEVAKEVRDPRFARRATEIALAARQRTLALDAATLWADLEPAARSAEAGHRRNQGRGRLSRQRPERRARARARRSGERRTPAR